MADISDNLAENAAAPRRAQGDSGSMEQHSLPDQIAADKYLLAKQAMKNRALGIRYVQLRPDPHPDAPLVSPGEQRHDCESTTNARRASSGIVWARSF